MRTRINDNKVNRIIELHFQNRKETLKQLSSRCLKNKKRKNKIKLTVNTGLVIFSDEIY